VAVQTLPLEYEITCYARTTLLREFRWRSDGVNPQDFTGWSATLLIGPALNGNIATFEASTTTTGLALTPDGRVIIDVPDTVTSTWPTGTTRYTLDLTDPTGYTVRFLRGRFNVVHELDPPP
jgi:hypothetical protein